MLACLCLSLFFKSLFKILHPNFMPLRLCHIITTTSPPPMPYHHYHYHYQCHVDFATSDFETPLFIFLITMQHKCLYIPIPKTQHPYFFALISLSPISTQYSLHWEIIRLSLNQLESSWFNIMNIKFIPKSSTLIFYYT